MKKTKLLLSLALATASFISTAKGQTWETYPQGGFSPSDLAVQPDGSVAYAAGHVPIPGQSFWPSKIRRGDAGGTTWQDVSLPVNCDYAHEVAVAPDGTVYLVGSERRGTLAEGRVWTSGDGGTTWSTIAEFPAGGQMPRDIQADANGNVFLTISKIIYTAKSSTRHLVTYKGTPDAGAPAGMTWTAVDDFLGAGQTTCIPHTLTLRPGDGAQSTAIWIAGYQTDGRTHSPMVRRSLDGGSTWATVSTWPVPSAYNFASGSWRLVAVADRNGVAFASVNYGKKIRQAIEYHWLTYRSLNSGLLWTLVNDVVANAEGPGSATTDTHEGVFIAGGGLTRASVDGGNTWVNAGITGANPIAADLVGNVFAGGFTTEGVIYKLSSP